MDSERLNSPSPYDSPEFRNELAMHLYDMAKLALDPKNRPVEKNPEEYQGMDGMYLETKLSYHKDGVNYRLVSKHTLPDFIDDEDPYVLVDDSYNKLYMVNIDQDAGHYCLTSFVDYRLNHPEDLKTVFDILNYLAYAKIEVESSEDNIQY